MRVFLCSFRGWARLLRPLFGTKKREPMYIRGCSVCGRLSADVREDPHAHDGWSFDQRDAWCPECKETGAASVEPVPDLEEIREHFKEQIHEIKAGGKL
jgi:hypothetical protein